MSLTRRDPDQFTFSVSATTRPRRSGEVDGVDYHFLTRADFRARVSDGGFAEWAEVHGQLYGTPLSSLDPDVLQGRIPVLDIDVQGAEEVRRRVPSAAVIFLLPPSPEVWIERLVGRGTEGPEEIRLRLETACSELERAPLFEEFVVNTTLDQTVSEIGRLLDGHLSAGVSSLRAEALCRSLIRGAERWLRDGANPQTEA